MALNTARTRLILATIAVVAVAAGLAWWSGAHERSAMSPSAVIAKHPSGVITVGGVVVESEARNRRMSILLADPSAPTAGVLRLEYSGAQKVSFEPGTVAIARGSLSSEGLFRVDEFVLK